ncbi:MAG: MerR family transcriptional regulator [Formosimonas sp.]
MSEIVQGLTIGQLAQAAGVHVETIRYYQKRGLLPQVSAPAVGYKRYSPELLARIAFIKSAQHMDFSLNEIKELFELSDAQLDKNKIRQVARERLQQVQQAKLHLDRVDQTLTQWLKQCECSSNEAACPIIDSIKHP